MYKVRERCTNAARKGVSGGGGEGTQVAVEILASLSASQIVIYRNGRNESRPNPSPRLSLPVEKIFGTVTSMGQPVVRTTRVDTFRRSSAINARNTHKKMLEI
ncbi:hypothetical protein P5V15_004593 [Pogonomyrmex californicus]